MIQAASITKKEIDSQINKTLVAKVAIELPYFLNADNEGCFYYLIPDEIKEEIKAGSIVRIPFGRQELTGYVLGITNKENIHNDYNLKEIYSIIYNKVNFDNSFLKFIQWVSSYYLTNIGNVLAASVTSDLFDTQTEVIELNDEAPLKNNTKEQIHILEKLLKSKEHELSYRYLLQKSRLNKKRFHQILNQLKKKGMVKTEFKNPARVREISKQEYTDKISHFFPCSEENKKKAVLNNDQQKAYNVILKSIEKKEPSCYLLYGVTGSGKTEVYLNLIEEVIKQNRNVIYLVPEIYLTGQIFQRLINRFNKENIIIWHSSLTKSERLLNVEKLTSGKVKIVLGARSAILAPVQNTGLIIVDEAHDAAYKQASQVPRYNAINLAEKKAQIENCVVVLGTATPNISDYYTCSQNKTILELPNRIENYPMPDVHIVDMSSDENKTTKKIIPNILSSQIKEALNKNEQVILLLNRRGYSSHVFCRSCSYIQFCRNCSVPLVFHKNTGLIVCHHCGYKTSYINNCPSCNSPHFSYWGIGTQRLEEEIKINFPGIKVIRVDKDQLRKKNEYLRLWSEFANGNANILIGTQLVAKGLDLPNVTVVGVIHVDAMLNFPDYVSYERAYQLLTQVTGRAGRGIKPGKVFIQTYQSKNHIFELIKNHDYKSFYKTEIENRKNHLYPPFTNLTRIIFQSEDEKECISHANYVLKILQETKDQIPSSQLAARSSNVSFLGPAPCFFTKLHNKHRYHILCKFPDEETTNHFFHSLFKIANKNAKVETIIDVDSINLL